MCFVLILSDFSFHHMGNKNKRKKIKKTLQLQADLSVYFREGRYVV